MQDFSRKDDYTIAMQRDTSGLLPNVQPSSVWFSLRKLKDFNARDIIYLLNMIIESSIATFLIYLPEKGGVKIEGFRYCVDRYYVLVYTKDCEVLQAYEVPHFTVYGFILNSEHWFDI